MLPAAATDKALTERPDRRACGQRPANPANVSSSGHDIGSGRAQVLDAANTCVVRLSSAAGVRLPRRPSAEMRRVAGDRYSVNVAICVFFRAR